MKRLVFEPTDIPYLSFPSLSDINVAETSRQIVKHDRRSAKKSYNPNFSQMKNICTGMADLALLKSDLAPKKPIKPQTAAWMKSVYAVCECLYTVYGAEQSTWYPARRVPIEILPGAWFKSAIRGVRVNNGVAKAHLINPRKSMFLREVDFAFLARWLIEFHIRDDANIQGFEIVDFGANPNGGDRSIRIRTDESLAPMTLEVFEATIERFLDAVQLAGFATLPNDAAQTTDLFRKHW